MKLGVGDSGCLNAATWLIVNGWLWPSFPEKLSFAGLAVAEKSTLKLRQSSSSAYIEVTLPYLGLK